MSQHRTGTDYDRTEIPEVYDRGRDHGPEVLDLWMNRIEAGLAGRPVGRILDVGCGTGRFSDSLAIRFDADVVGIDPSEKMLRQARVKRRDGRVLYARARAEELPLASGCIDLIFLSMSFHHFTNRAHAAQECRRVLRRRGSVFVRTASSERIPEYPYVPFFPAARPVLEEVLPTVGEVRNVFEVAGFSTVGSEIVLQTVAPDWNAYAEKLSTGADSILARIGRPELEAGLRAVRIHAAGMEARAVEEPIDFLTFR